MAVVNRPEKELIEIKILEGEVLSLAAQGFSAEEIAQLMGLNLKSIKKLLDNMSRKIEAVKRPEREKA